MKGWPFADPPNLAVITVRQFVHDGQPILLVLHDIDDGSWQFLTGEGFNEADGMVVSLQNMVSRDPSLAELCDLPLGWKAYRQLPGAPWHWAVH